jgi:hypothetical protein
METKEVEFDRLKENFSDNEAKELSFTDFVQSPDSVINVYLRQVSFETAGRLAEMRTISKNRDCFQFVTEEQIMEFLELRQQFKNESAKKLTFLQYLALQDKRAEELLRKVPIPISAKLSEWRLLWKNENYFAPVTENQKKRFDDLKASYANVDARNLTYCQFLALHEGKYEELEDDQSILTAAKEIANWLDELRDLRMFKNKLLSAIGML